jgi:anti-sigma B factor antagonist
VPFTSLSHEGFSITVEPSRTEVAVVPAGELDVDTARAVEQEVRDLRRTGFEHIVVDLRRLDFMDSSGLRTLLTLRGDAERAQGRLTLRPGPQDVQRIFDLTGTISLFDWRR